MGVRFSGGKKQKNITNGIDIWFVLNIYKFFTLRFLNQPSNRVFRIRTRTMPCEDFKSNTATKTLK